VLLANGAVTTSVLIAYAAFVAFAHSNTNLGFGPLGRILVSPNYHRIHHRRDGAQDVNLAFAFTIWDQLARRAVFPDATTIRIDTGIQGRPLAVEQAGPRPRYLSVFAAQLIGPFRPMARPVDLPSVRESQSARET
jgi:sterol desaturase/sphingolipid hydroxylase (fatty acid hydroxylase superfamily)